MRQGRDMEFADRRDAGHRLARGLARYAGRNDVVVLGLPRGGVPVAFEVARALGAPLDVFAVRKLGVPGHEELAMGAIASGGVQVLNDSVVQQLRIDRADIESTASAEREELDRREQAYRDGRAPADVAGKVVILVDDGLATGSTMRAAVSAVRRLQPSRVVVAVPTASAQACEDLRQTADDVVCTTMPSPFYAVGMSYHDFSQTTDAEVRDLLRRSAPPAVHDIAIHVDDGALAATVAVPSHPTGVVLFAHGSGSSRHSSRNQAVARVLREAGLATVLADLLTPEEDAFDRRTARLRFDIDLLARRVAGAAARLAKEGPGELAGLPIGLFGASTGAAAALVAAAARPDLVSAVVSRGGRADLAGPALGEVKAPTLLIVGGRDEVVLGLNREASTRLSGVKELVVIRGATHLFEEPGALEQVAGLAANWFTRHLR